MSRRERAARLDRHEEKPSGGTTPAQRAVEFTQQDAGRPLDAATRSLTERDFGHSFANVRVHADDAAARQAGELHAPAFTVGQHVVFGREQYDPETPVGHALLSHELAHTVQNERAATGPDDAERSGSSDPAEYEARHVALSALAGGRVTVGAAPAARVAASTEDDLDDINEAEQNERAARKDEWALQHRDTDQGATAKEQKGMQKQLAAQPKASAGNEQNLAAEGGVTMPHMQLYDETRMQGGAQIKHFETSYAMFRPPMKMALGSLGRVQDMVTAGAPQTPKDMSKGMKGMFHKLKGGEKDSQLKIDFGVWADHTSSLNKGLEDYLAVFGRLQSALTAWREMEQRILIKQKKAQIANDNKKLEKLEAPAKMIVGVLEVIEKASSAYELLKPSEGASEAVADVEVLQAATEVDTDIRTTSQKGAGAYGTGKGAYKKVKGVASKLIPGVSTEDVLNFLMGNSDEIAGLKAHIAKLKQDIADADEKAEEFKIDSALELVQAVTKENRAAALGVSVERSKARESAASFAGVMGGESVDARMVTLCAEAYQELRIFGEKALEQYAELSGSLPEVEKFLSDSGRQFEIKHTRDVRRDAAERGGPGLFAYNDYEALLEASTSARGYGELLEKEVPGWRARADAWAAFFSKETGSTLDEFDQQKKRAAN